MRVGGDLCCCCRAGIELRGLYNAEFELVLAGLDTYAAHRGVAWVIVFLGNVAGDMVCKYMVEYDGCALGIYGK